MAGQVGFLGSTLGFNMLEPTTIPRTWGNPKIYKLRASTHQRNSECTVAMPGLATGP